MKKQPSPLRIPALDVTPTLWESLEKGDIEKSKLIITTYPKKVKYDSIYYYQKIHSYHEKKATVLSLAVFKKYHEIVQLMLESGNNVLAHDEKLHKNGPSAIFIACYQNDIEMVKLLLKHGANVNDVKGYVKNPSQTPLYNVCRNVEVAHLVVEKMDQLPPHLLHYYIVSFDFSNDFMDMVLKKGFNVYKNVQYYDKCLFHMAVEGNHSNAARYLLINNLVDIHYIYEQRDIDPGYYRYERNPQVYNLLHLCAYCDRFEFAKLLVLKGTNVHFQDQNGKSAWECFPEEWKKVFKPIIVKLFPAKMSALSDVSFQF